MATYIYETIPKKKGQKPRRFELQQSMKDDALTQDPKTGEPIKRVITGGTGSFDAALAAFTACESRQQPDGYCSVVISSAEFLSNQHVCAGGATSNIGFHIRIPFDCHYAGTYHFRMTILPQEEDLVAFIDGLAKFQKKIYEKYGTPAGG